MQLTGCNVLEKKLALHTRTHTLPVYNCFYAESGHTSSLVIPGLARRSETIAHPLWRSEQGGPSFWKTQLSVDEVATCDAEGVDLGCDVELYRELKQRFGT